MPSPATSARSTNLEHVNLSSSEQCSIEHFVTQYIQTREIEPNDNARQVFLAALKDYPCTARVSLYELNAWLDNRLGLRASYRQFWRVVDGLINQRRQGFRGRGTSGKASSE